MTNREAYAHGLLNRALDSGTQPDAIRAFLREQEELLPRLVPPGSRVVDFGCGDGRHLVGLADRISLGVGLDYEPAYVAEATRANPHERIHFLVADGAATPLTAGFDVALCLTSTWGTMADKLAVFEEMKRLAPEPGTRLITAYGPASVEPRTEWYARLGNEVTEVAEDHIMAGGFRSEHFSEDRLRDLLGPCTLHPLGDIGYLAAA